MTCLILALALIGQPQTPAETHAAALGDLITNVPPEMRRTTRYLSLNAAPEGEQRESLYRAMAFALNSTSPRSRLATMPRTYKNSLIRLDLATLGWDKHSRQARLSRLSSQGVDISGFSADLWEEFTKDDPYFFASTNYGGSYVRGWVDPQADKELRTQTYSAKPVLRADWLLPRLLTEKQAGGYYSQALLLPAKEADLYKSLGVNISLIDSDSQLRSGGAVLDSIVALHNRELQLIPSLYGWDEKFIWRTFDFAADQTGDKSVIETLAGRVKHDGREIIGTLPNGLHWYYLADGAGSQVAVVPQNIAIDQRIGTFEKLKDRSVVNAYKCVSCHGPVSGIQPFDDVIGKAILAPNIGLAIVKEGYAYAGASALKEAIEDYYLVDTPGKIQRQNASYAARLKACNGLDPGTNSQAVNTLIESYVYDLVTPDQAAREMGYSDLPRFREACRVSGNPYMVLLSSGQGIRRASYESAWADAMRTRVYPWEAGLRGK